MFESISIQMSAFGLNLGYAIAGTGRLVGTWPKQLFYVISERLRLPCLSHKFPSRYLGFIKRVKHIGESNGPPDNT